MELVQVVEDNSQSQSQSQSQSTQAETETATEQTQTAPSVPMMPMPMPMPFQFNPYMQMGQPVFYPTAPSSSSSDENGDQQVPQVAYMPVFSPQMMYPYGYPNPVNFTAPADKQ